MTEPAKPKATLADLLAIPEEDRRHEIIDGVLVEKQAATGRHGQAQARLARGLGPYDRRPGGRSPGGWWLAVEVEVLFEETQILRPDVLGWRRERLPAVPAEFPTTVRPDWVCEILSTARACPRPAAPPNGGADPSTNKRNDLILKKRAYHRAGVGHYWIIDPIEETLAVYRWHADGYVEVLIAERNDRVRAEPFDAIEVRLGVLFGDDEDE